MMGSGLVWDSYSSMRYKIALINILVNSARRSCSPCNLPAEMEKIMNILGENGYPVYIIEICAQVSKYDKGS